MAGNLDRKLRLPRIHFRILLLAANMRHGTNGFTSLPKEGVLRIFSPWKIQLLRPGLNRGTWLPKASTLPLEHRSRYDDNDDDFSVFDFRLFTWRFNYEMTGKPRQIIQQPNTTQHNKQIFRRNDGLTALITTIIWGSLWAERDFWLVYVRIVPGTDTFSRVRTLLYAVSISKLLTSLVAQSLATWKARFVPVLAYLCCW